MDWTYYTFEDGKLLDEEGFQEFDKTFLSADEAEQWLVDNDIRGSVR